MKITIKNRVPKNFFVVKGKGESDNTIHAGSYHLALREAGIEKANIITYSSILPAIACEIKKPTIVHGEVMETIMSVVHAHKGETKHAGMIWGWLYDEHGHKQGGFVCENVADTQEELHKKLETSIHELHQNGYQHLQLRDIKKITETITATKQHGTALVGICFVNYEIELE